MTAAQLALGDPVVNSIGMVLVPIAAGEFLMGSPDSDGAANDDEKPRHLVKITEPFYLGAMEVTQGQWQTVMRTRPWRNWPGVEQGKDYAASFVGWSDAMEFCRRLSEQEDVEYRLPTEAEWEYACRGGTTTTFSFGDDTSNLGQYAWYFDNTQFVGEDYAHRVGQKLPNPWGLYDMHGNVEEWCQDWYAPFASEKAVINPNGPPQGTFRVQRSGNHLSNHIRSAFRDSTSRSPDPNKGFRMSGFRVAKACR